MSTMRPLQFLTFSPARYSVVGHYTNNLVFDRLAPGLLKGLQSRTPKNEKGDRPNKLHQWLTRDVGDPMLSQHLHSIVMLQRLAIANGHGWNRFLHTVDQVLPRRGDPNDPFVGISFVQSIPAVIDSGNYMMEYNRKYFLNGARRFRRTNGPWTYILPFQPHARCSLMPRIRRRDAIQPSHLLKQIDLSDVLYLFLVEVRRRIMVGAVGSGVSSGVLSRSAQAVSLSAIPTAARVRPRR